MKLKNSLNDTQRTLDEEPSQTSMSTSRPKPKKRRLRAIFGVVVLLAVIVSLESVISDEPTNLSFLDDIGDGITEVMSRAQYSEELLEGMGSWLVEMGYGEYTKEQLIQLRDQGVTATYISRIRDLGYENVTIDEIVRMIDHDVSARFARMMHELGYDDLGVEDLIRLRDHDVTAHFTSNLHDLGYSEVSAEELIRLKDVGVSINTVKKLLAAREELPSVEEIIRYQISNQ